VRCAIIIFLLGNDAQVRVVEKGLGGGEGRRCGLDWSVVRCTGGRLAVGKAVLVVLGGALVVVVVRPLDGLGCVPWYCMGYVWYGWIWSGMGKG